MTVFVIVLLLIALGGLLCMVPIASQAVFSDERVYNHLKYKEKLSHEDAMKVIDKLKPKVGEPGLPSWESKKRNLKKEEM
jgi:hypothetical protein